MSDKGNQLVIHCVNKVWHQKKNNKMIWGPSQYVDVCLTSLGVPIKKIRGSHDHCIMKIPIPGKTVFILKWAPGYLWQQHICKKVTHLLWQNYDQIKSISRNSVTNFANNCIITVQIPWKLNFILPPAWLWYQYYFLHMLWQRSCDRDLPHPTHTKVIAFPAKKRPQIIQKF